VESYKIDETQFEWEKDVSLLNNPILLGDTLKVFGVVFIIIYTLISLLFLVNYKIDFLMSNLPLIFIFMSLLFIVKILLFILKYKDNFRFKFTLSDEMIYVEMMDKISPTVKNNFLFFPAIILLEMIKRIDENYKNTPIFKEMSSTHWNSVTKALYHPSKKVIILRNRWRNTITIYCTDENYLMIASFVKNKILITNLKSKEILTPLIWAFIHTALIIIACLPLFILPYPYNTNLLPTILLACFALATIWLSRFFGYIVLGVIGYTIWLYFTVVYTQQLSISNLSFMFFIVGTCMIYIVTISIMSVSGMMYSRQESNQSI